MLKIRGGGIFGVKKRRKLVSFEKYVYLYTRILQDSYIRGQRMVLLYGRGCNWLIDMYLSVSRGAKGISV